MRSDARLAISLEEVMGERTERAVLNQLIENCRDAERGLRVAADQVKSTELQRVLTGLADQRHAFANERRYAQRLGGASVSEGTAAAAYTASGSK